MKRVLLTLIAVGVGFAAIVTILEVPFAPWARSFGMWPTLTGTWTGTLATADGRTQPTFFAIAGGVRRRGSTYLDGKMRLCERRGTIRDFEISGQPDNWRGSRFSMSLRILDDHDWSPGPGELRGEWHGDDLRATGVLISRAPVATAEATRSSAAEPAADARYTLRRGTENDFLGACREMTQD